MGKSHDLATIKDDGLTVDNGNGNFVYLTTDGAIEMRRSGGGGYIDFHGSAVDYDARIQHHNNGLAFNVGGQGNHITGATIDASGRVTMQYQPSFLAYGSGGWQSGTTNGIGTWAWGRFINVQHNQGGHYNSTNNRFTAPVSGVYYLYVQAYHNSTAYARAQLWVNGGHGGAMPYALSHGRNTSGDSTLVSAMNVYLNAGDYVHPALYMDNGSIYYGGGHTYFSGYLIG